MTLRFRHIIICVLFLAFLAFYFIFDPMESGYMPQCVFNRLTGWNCVGCGTQRMLHAMLHGDFVAAFKANALVFCSLPVVGFLLWLEFKRKKYPGLYAGVHSRFFIISVGVIFLGWMFLRNLLDL